MVSTLALRGARMVTRSMSRGRYGRAYRGARAGVYVARTLFRNRRGIARAARTIQRAYRGRSRRIAGEPSRGQANQAWYLANGVPGEAGRSTRILQNRKTMWSAPIFLCKPPGAVEVLGQPSRNAVRLRGLKVCIKAENPSFEVKDTCIFHIAIIQPKGFDTPTGQGGSGVSLSDFFSRPGGGDPGSDRTEAFVPFATSPQVNWDYNCNGINKEKWNILTHVKRRIQCKGSAYQMGTSLLSYEKYFPMKSKRLQYDSIGNSYVTRPLILCMWHERMVSDDPEALNLNMHVNTVGYFSEGK